MGKVRRRIMRTFKLQEISAVDNPAQAHARMVLMKRDVSEDERERLADKGKALPDGSFPIASRSDLENAVQAFGRAKDKAKAKRHIIARARALDALDALPDGWDVKKSDEGDDEPLTAVEKQQLDDLQAAVDALVDKAQARVPAGSSAGGQFASGSGSSGKKTEAEGWRHLPKATQQKLAGIQSEIEALEAKEWTPELGRKHDALLAQRAELGWKNPWAPSIQALLGVKKDYGACSSPSDISRDVKALDFDDVLAADEAIQATYQVKDDVWRHWNALQRSFETIAADEDVEAAAKVTAMRESLNQFIASLAEETREDVTKCIAAVPVLAGLLEKSEEGDDDMTAAEKQQLDELQKTVAKLTKQLEAATAAEPAKQAAELTTALETAQAESAELTKKLAAAEAASKEALAKAGMSDEEKACMDKMSDEDKKDFMEMSVDDRKKKMKKAVDEDPVVYKAADGTEFRKSAGEALVAMAKRVDESEKLAKAEREQRETVELAKRADDELKSFSETVAKRDDKIEVLRAIEKMEAGPKAAILKMLEVGGKAIGAAFETIGHRSEAVAKSGQDFEKHVGAIMARDKITKVAAMSKARVEHPEEFEAYQAASTTN